MWRKGNTSALFMGMHIGAATVESSMEISQKIKINLLLINDLTSGNKTEGIQNTALDEHKHPYVHCRVIYNSQDMEAAQVSTST